MSRAALAEKSFKGERPRLRTWSDWLAGAGSALLDQGLVSGANFVLSILLARRLAASSYGVYAVVGSIAVVFTGIHSALVLEPMSVLGPARFSTTLDSYLGLIVRMHGVVAAPVILLLLGAGLVCWLVASLHPFVAPLVALALALPCLLLFLAVRRFWYLDHRPQRALAGSAIYMTLVLGGAAMLVTAGEASPTAAFLLIGVSSLCAAMALLGRLRIAHARDAKRRDRSARGTWADHWSYGRWILLASLTYWGSTEIYYGFTAWHGGLEEAAALRALQNLVAPAIQAMAALGTLLLPWVSAVCRESGEQGVRVVSRNITVVMTAGALAFAAVLWVADRPIMQAVYGGHYDSHAHLLRYLAIMPVLIALASGSQIALRAMQRPWAILIGYGAGSALTLTLGCLAVGRWGVEGAVLGLALSLGVYALVLHLLVRGTNQSGARGIA